MSPPVLKIRLDNINTSCFFIEKKGSGRVASALFQCRIFKEPLAVRSFIVFPGLNLDRIEKNLPVHRDDLYGDKVIVQFHDIINYLGEFVKTRFVIENKVLDERGSREA